MPRYQLVTLQLRRLAAFDAADDDDAEQHARSVARDVPAPSRGTFLTFLLEREDGVRWRTVRAWVPDRIDPQLRIDPKGRRYGT